MCTWVRFPPRTPSNFYSELSISHCLFLSFCLPIACAWCSSSSCGRARAWQWRGDPSSPWRFPSLENRRSESVLYHGRIRGVKHSQADLALLWPDLMMVVWSDPIQRLIELHVDRVWRTCIKNWVFSVLCVWFDLFFFIFVCVVVNHDADKNMEGGTLIDDGGSWVQSNPFGLAADKWSGSSAPYFLNLVMQLLV